LKVKFVLMFLILSVSSYAYGQWDDGVILDVQEVDIDLMKKSGLQGAEAVLMVVEQFVDQTYKFIYISKNYEANKNQKELIKDKPGSFTVGLLGFPGNNNLIYAQVMYDKKFFIIAVAKDADDVKVIKDVQLIRMNYEKKNPVRRNNVKETIQKNNVIPIGIEGR